MGQISSKNANDCQDTKASKKKEQSVTIALSVKS
jgi:hypothetical protein